MYFLGDFYAEAEEGYFDMDDFMNRQEEDNSSDNSSWKALSIK